ncbi:MOSC domain-containing protein [Sphingomonas sp. HF-S4]|uniref:MOSC domain-containing protein n=1 Tax=Sphingomonas agrestis TaxID=3080540 RepID=A0ABU3Y812_9SPHN|nr:MOSC domain-containing protein [Sphingomonas sp. HF-S4]MDV3457313.1 MOSC domain-containing protein [Sphingomonas sp. HF-S4]
MKPPAHHAIDALLTGPVRPLGPRHVASGIDKCPQDRTLRLSFTGLAGDEQGDTRHHGGPDKAVHHYPSDHYSRWRDEIGAHPLLDRPGAFGENIAASGLTEVDIAVGDRFRLGTALVEVSQGRQPCFRLNLRFELRDMARRMQDSGRTGWYYRVIEEGEVGPDDTLHLLDRAAPEWTIDRLRRILYVDVKDRDSLAAIAALPLLPARWRETAARRLVTGTVEDWRKRLDGV